MRGNEFLDKMGLVEAAFVEAADIELKRQKFTWTRFTAVAACFVLMFFAVSNFMLRTKLPLLSISVSNDGMGFEGYGAYDISELVNANPWSEDFELAILPVFKNPITYDEFHIASGADIEKMRSILLEVAGRLGLDADMLTITDDAPDEETKQKMAEGFKMATRLETLPDGYFDPTMLMTEAEGMKLEVDQFLTVTIRFDPSVPLPEEYSFANGTTYADVAEYLKTAYQDLIGFDDPQLNLSGGDRNIYGHQSFSIEFFEGDKHKTKQIVNYHFNRVAFSFDDEGKLFIARVYRPDITEKVGDYPIITVEEANELLANGNYITTVPYELPGMDYVKKVELVYRNDRDSEYFMPYYRFYVELPDMELDNGMKTYGAYYVPAVSGEYIENMPLWDGSFN